MAKIQRTGQRAPVFSENWTKPNNNETLPLSYYLGVQLLQTGSTLHFLFGVFGPPSQQVTEFKRLNKLATSISTTFLRHLRQKAYSSDRSHTLLNRLWPFPFCVTHARHEHKSFVFKIYDDLVVSFDAMVVDITTNEYEVTVQ